MANINKWKVCVRDVVWNKPLYKSTPIFENVMFKLSKMINEDTLNKNPTDIIRRDMLRSKEIS